MEHQGIQPHHNIDDQRHGDDQGQQQLGMRRRIRPDTAIPPTVLAADMGDRSRLLRSWRDEPSTHLSPSDAVPLRRKLTAAFESKNRTPISVQVKAL